jgi:DNA-binding transcriptional LysR family regulator
LLRKLDLTSLRLFAAVCQEHSIARAAEREFIAPSAVSRRIAELESLLGLSLMQRHTRGVTITPAGETVLHHARRIIGDVESMGAELSRLYAGVKGHVRVVANLSAIVQFLPEDVAAFQRLFPEVEIDLEERHSQDVLKLVGERAADFGICNRSAGAQGLQALTYRNDRLAVMLPAGHPRAQARQLALKDIVHEPFVGLGDDSALTQLLAAQAQALGVALKVKIRVTSLDALCRMAHAGLGIAIMPLQVAQLYLKALDVVACPLSDAWAQRELCIVFQDRGRLSATAGALVRFLSQQDV